jgi:transcription elongation factor Elf1
MPMHCPKCDSENTVVAMIDSTYYHGPAVICGACKHVAGRNLRPIEELEAEEKARRKAARGWRKWR